jgi:UDP-glucose 4-epimerase
MTRFLMSLDDAVDTIAAAVATASRGETMVPRPPAARMVDLAKSLMGDQELKIQITGIRPGEKLHEILISDEERHRTIFRGNYYAIRPMLPELQDGQTHESAGLQGEYSSDAGLLAVSEIRKLLQKSGLTRTETSEEAGVR